MRKEYSYIVKVLFCLLILCVGSLMSYAQEDSPFRVFVASDRLTFIEGEPVEISAVVQNYSRRTQSFFVYDVNYTTFQPVVYKMDGREAETTVQYRQMNRTTPDVLSYIEPRKSIISPDEKIVKRFNIADYYNLEPGKEYRVKLFFLADAKNPEVIRSENSINIRIAPLERDADESIKPQERYIGVITPSEVVLLCLTSEKSKSWSKMLKYIWLEKFVNAYPDYGMSYNAGSETVRKKVIRDFATYLSTSRHDYIVDFNIVSESILESNKMAYVEAKVVRNSAPRPYVYIYRYSLEKQLGSWYITGIEATVSKERIIEK